ncbi:hypothetical protein JOB18_008370 [Solea senegalensis]|uniref:Uncharacterized protein n=1 Tax=Solea senegalensis TaxID=28829 RepID=A0AAV6RC66_SOLSE|nr:hypothetical protein JOB18_008370 [Solea senegalensis]
MHSSVTPIMPFGYVNEPSAFSTCSVSLLLPCDESGRQRRCQVCTLSHIETYKEKQQQNNSTYSNFSVFTADVIQPTSLELSIVTSSLGDRCRHRDSVCHNSGLPLQDRTSCGHEALLSLLSVMSQPCCSSDGC